MIERGPDRSVRARRRKHSEERESGVSEWKSARAQARAKQKGGEIAEERKQREMLFIHTARLLTSPTPAITQSAPNTQPLDVREEGHEGRSEIKRESIPPFVIGLSHSPGHSVS